MGALKDAGTCPRCHIVSEEVAKGEPCPGGCDSCELCADPKYPVPHAGSPYCFNAERGKNAGSIASGGTRSHCTCDACF